MTDAGYPVPKYVRVMVELRRRIESGVYAPGDMLPSEAVLTREFGVGRTTVVRALQTLQQEGWISREQGVASYAKAPPVAQSGGTHPGRALLDRSEIGQGVSVVGARRGELPGPVAALLGKDQGAPGVVRQVVSEHGGDRVELVSLWFPEHVAAGTDLANPAPLPVGVRQHVRAVKGLRVERITERLSARLPTTAEADLLKIDVSAPVLGVLATVLEAGGRPLLVADVVLPGTVHELEDSYSVTD